MSDDLTPEGRAALARHGYDPNARPSGISGTTRTWRGADGVLLRCHVCELDGIEVDGHRGSDLDPVSPACLHCDHGWDQL